LYYFAISGFRPCHEVVHWNDTASASSLKLEEK